MKKKTILLFIFLFFTGRIFAGEIDVTSVKRTYEVTLNEILKIREIELVEENGKKRIQMPIGILQSGEIYPQVILLTRSIEEKILDTIDGVAHFSPKGRPVDSERSEEERKKLKYKIGKFKTGIFEWDGPGDLMAAVWVDFNKEISVKLKIIETRGGIQIGWPSVIKDRGLRHLVIITDDKLKKEIEEKIIGKFESKRKKLFKK